MQRWLESLRHTKLLKSIVYFFIGIFTYPGLAIINSIQIRGTEHLKRLPKKNVLFVSNHQTYFMDVITFLHIFSAVKWGKKNRLGIPYYLLNPFTRVNYVAAAETMKKSWVSRLFRWAGAITVQRAWKGERTQKGLIAGDIKSIGKALESNWVITFPQGTTTPFAPGRKGTAFIIKQTKPVVIPVVINGFWRAYNKTGLKFKKKGIQLSVTFKPPMDINFDDNMDVILEQIMGAIEQNNEFKMKGRHHRAERS